MTTTIYCPQCHQEYDLDESTIGCNVQCAVCNTEFIAQSPVNSDSILSKKTDETHVEQSDGMPIYCPHCKKANSSKTTYCVFCGIKMDMSEKCPFCNANLIKDAIFCPDCGRRVDITNTTDNRREIGELAHKTIRSLGVSSKETAKRSLGLLKNKYENMSKKRKIVFVSVVSLIIVSIVFIIALSGKSKSTQETAIRSTSTGSSSSSLAKNQSDADAAALLLLMGAAAAQQNTQASRQNSMPVVCTSCGGLGYKTGAYGERVHCYTCKGTGYMSQYQGNRYGW